jgi:hypothetical protein
VEKANAVEVVRPRGADVFDELGAVADLKGRALVGGARLARRLSGDSDRLAFVGDGHGARCCVNERAVLVHPVHAEDKVNAVETRQRAKALLAGMRSQGKRHFGSGAFDGQLLAVC